jgi:protein TonB
MTGTGVSATVTLRLTLNESGAVAEVSDGASAIPGPVSPQFAGALASFVAPFLTSATEAVRQWIYEPPAKPPVSFGVRFSFRDGAETGLMAHGIDVPRLTGPGARAAVSTSSVSASSTGQAPVRVGGNIPAPRKLKDVKAEYPAIARAAGVSGIVIVETTIDTQGRVSNARVIRSVALLDAAALSAVSQWEFTPTLLNGSPVPIIMSVTVNFSGP